jgi:DNA modification methylase
MTTLESYEYDDSVDKTSISFKYKFLVGNSLDVLKTVPDSIFHTAVTSPPYWDQRDYGVDGQLGQEATPEGYVDNLVAICHELKRTLRDDGTLWLNIGDGYAKKSIKSSYLKQKDLVGIPWMLAFAMRRDGWYLRSDIIWQKENPMPESTKDRPSKSYEHLFLFSKSDKYFYDYYSIAVPQKDISIKRAFSKNHVEDRKDYNNDNYAISGASQNKTYQKLQKDIESGKEIKCNKRDIWTTSTAAEKEKHFAVYPDKLIEPCIKAGSSEKGCCAECRSPLYRIGETDKWEKKCDCKTDKVKPCLVLDPFNGSGTTGRVSSINKRRYVGIDISEEYLKTAREVFRQHDVFGENEVEIEDLL